MPLSLEINDLVVRGRRGGRELVHVPRLVIAAGEAVGVRGPSGAGKSSLLFALAGLSPFVEGEVRWGTENIAAMSSARTAAFRRSHVGMIFQDHLLFEELGPEANASIAGAFARRAERAGRRERAAAALRRLAVPEGARNVETFSGGERQRVAVARALAGAPSILLADEPTASLPREASVKLTEDLLHAARDRGATLIAVSHDLALLDAMDRVITIEHGRILETAQ
ncbi:ABC transporter ATP-binding protein [Tropicimonas sp. IMCC34011]|uniref:ABC transporter ATP-binding protein n=1 Tax=Tropicimonas sp. IMCC34011 TaxID=2248759 RepID=UPI001E4AE100|nr:ABC transporter ATP-binding protein [Tropicimonas sp. IMCC34011]